MFGKFLCDSAFNYLKRKSFGHVRAFLFDRNAMPLQELIQGQFTGIFTMLRTVKEWHHSAPRASEELQRSDQPNPLFIALRLGSFRSVARPAENWHTA
jgi:hypothetical protein